MVYPSSRIFCRTDPRLSYDYQCYGGLDYFEVQAASGNLENSRIWTPDIELYNHKTSIWGDGALGSRLAIVYSCWDGKPTRGGCGEVFFSRPGVISALCRYSGLLNFPNDELSCDLEFAAWGIDGRHQDIIPRIKDGGVNWIDKPVAEGEVKSVTGLTSGSSFQDYRIGQVSITRKVTFYDCCPNSPYPTLLYNLVFVRSTNYYTFKLVIPSMVLTLLSFIAFYSKFCNSIFPRSIFCSLVLHVNTRSEPGDRRASRIRHYYDSGHACLGYHSV